MVIYVMLIALLQLAALVWLYWRSPEHRLPAGIMLGVVVVNRLIYVVSAAVGAGYDRLPVGTLAISLSAVSYSIAIFGFRILDPVPRARGGGTEP